MHQQHQISSKLAPDRFAGLSDTDAAVLLVGHGTADPGGQAELLATASMLRALLPRVAIEPSFLELATPRIDASVARLAELVRGQGEHELFSRLIVAPLLLFSAGHAKQDIPAAVQRAVAVRGLQVTIHQAAHLGCQDDLLRLSELRYTQAVSAFSDIDPEKTLLVLVGRGSRDEGATAEMHDFARRRAKLTPVGKVQTCFVAMAEPEFESTLQQISEQLRWGPLAGFRRVVFQPHLMFCGELLDRIKRRVMSYVGGKPPTKLQRQHAAELLDPAELLSVECAVDARGVEWIVTPHLGCHPLLASTIAARIAECIDGH